AAGDAADRDEFSRRYEPLVRTYLSVRWQVAAAHDRVSDGVHEVAIECPRPHGDCDGTAPPPRAARQVDRVDARPVHAPRSDTLRCVRPDLGVYSQRPGARTAARPARGATRRRAASPLPWAALPPRPAAARDRDGDGPRGRDRLRDPEAVEEGLPRGTV